MSKNNFKENKPNLNPNKHQSTYKINQLHVIFKRKKVNNLQLYQLMNNYTIIKNKIKIIKYHHVILKKIDNSHSILE